MTKGRLEAFSDGVLAIIITIMVLELKVPHAGDLADLRPLLPVLLSYILSFIYVGIYWNNHHHLLHTLPRVNAGIMWANLHLLFWLSLIPFATGWMGENNFAPAPTAFYGLILLMSGAAYWNLQRLILHLHGPTSPLARAIGNDLKGHLALTLYTLAIPAAFLSPWISCSLYTLVALMWIAPDKRIEAALKGASEHDA